MWSHGPEGLRTTIYSYPIQQQAISATRIDSGDPLHVDHATLVRSPASESVDDPTSATVPTGPYRNFGGKKSFQVTQRDVAMLQPPSLVTSRLSAGTSERRRPREDDESEIYETERPREALQLSSSLPRQLDPLEPEEYDPNKRIKQDHADMDIDIGSHIEGHIGPSSTALTTRSPTGHVSRRSNISLTAPTYFDHPSHSREEVSTSKQSEGQYEPCINDTAISRTLPPSTMTCPPSNGKRRATPRTEEAESSSAYASSNFTLANRDIQFNSPKKSHPSEGSSVAAQSQSLATGNTRSNSTHTYTDIEERRYTIDKSTEGGQGSGMVHHLEDTVETQSSVGITSTFPVHESRQDVQIAPSSKSQSPATNHSGINTPDGGKSASMHDTPLDTSIGECQVPTTGLVTNNTKCTQEATPNGRKESNRAQSPHGIRMQSQENLFSDTYETFEPAKSERSTVPEQAEENNFHSLSTAGSSSARDHPSSQALNPLVPQHSHVDRLSGNSEPGSETGDNLSATIPFGAEGNMPYPDAATTPAGSFEPPRVEEAGGNNVLTSRVIDNDTTQRVVGASTSDVGQGESSEPDSTPRGSSLNEEMPQTTEGSCDRSHPSTDSTKLAPHHTTVYLHNDHPQHQNVQVHNTAMEAATGTSDGLDLEPDPPSQVTVEPPEPRIPDQANIGVEARFNRPVSEEQMLDAQLSSDDDHEMEDVPAVSSLAKVAGHKRRPLAERPDSPILQQNTNTPHKKPKFERQYLILDLDWSKEDNVFRVSNYEFLAKNELPNAIESRLAKDFCFYTKTQKFIPTKHVLKELCHSHTMLASKVWMQYLTQQNHKRITQEIHRIERNERRNRRSWEKKLG
ncbi:hypothetical protein N7444_001548 [Penicillium canescens]|nr:hypothetical protein N7444_001548 [Penicillium canescens]